MARYCEWCGERRGLLDQIQGKGIRVAGDTGVHACTRCRAQVPLLAGAGARLHADRRIARPVLGTVLVAMVGSALLLANLAPPAPEGAVLGVSAAPATPTEPDGSDRSMAVPSPSSGPTFATSSAQAPGLPEPGLAEEPPVVIAWTDSFDRRRIQIIVPVRNESEGRIRISEASGYRLAEARGEVGRGRFTALPTVVHPGETAYLVATGADPSESSAPFDVEITLVSMRSEEPAPTITLSGLELDQAIGGGMRATGRVRNEGARVVGSVTVAAVALGDGGRPLGAAIDTHDVVRLPPGEVQTFATDVGAGAPNVALSDVRTVVGIAFEE